MSSVPTSQLKKWVEALPQVCSAYNHLSLRRREKDGKDVIGNIIKAKTAKSRLSKENQQVNVRLFYDERGLDRPIMDSSNSVADLEDCGRTSQDVTKSTEPRSLQKTIYSEPENTLRREVLEKLDVVAVTISYGG